VPVCTERGGPGQRGEGWNVKMKPSGYGGGSYSRRYQPSQSSSGSGAAPGGDDLLSWVAHWEKECAERVEALEANHDRARRALEAKLESQVSQASFSTHLMEVIQKEERAAERVSKV